MQRKSATLASIQLISGSLAVIFCRSNRALFNLLLLSASLGIANISYGQDRWFKVELSIFTNEDQADRDQELWQADRTTLDYPAKLIRLNELTDILLIDSLLPPPLAEQNLEDNLNESEPPEAENPSAEPTPELPPSKQELRNQAIMEVGPTIPRSGEPFQFFDLDRDEFLKLSTSFSDFAQTNRALQRSPDHRLLYHGIWRQIVVDEENSTSLLIEGGDKFFNQAELQGNLTIRFNDNADRVVLDADLWLSEFAIEQTDPGLSENELVQDGPVFANEEDIEPSWQLPEIPQSISNGPLQILQQQPESEEPSYSISRVFHMQQSRGMRSNEFHYLDHPALGIVVMVQPYEVPELPETLDTLLDESLNSDEPE